MFQQRNPDLGERRQGEWSTRNGVPPQRISAQRVLPHREYAANDPALSIELLQKNRGLPIPGQALGRFRWYKVLGIGGPCATRTHDHRIKSAVLYRLS